MEVYVRLATIPERGVNRIFTVREHLMLIDGEEKLCHREVTEVRYGKKVFRVVTRDIGEIEQPHTHSFRKKQEPTTTPRAFQF